MGHGNDDSLKSIQVAFQNGKSGNIQIVGGLVLMPQFFRTFRLTAYLKPLPIFFPAKARRKFKSILHFASRQTHLRIHEKTGNCRKSNRKAAFLTLTENIISVHLVSIASSLIAYDQSTVLCVVAAKAPHSQLAGNKAGNLSHSTVLNQVVKG